MPQPPEIDFPKAIREFAKRVFDNMSGMVVSGMIYLGDRLGLYKALHDAGPMTSEELAAKTGLHERWVREWLRGQAAAGLLDYHGDGRFALSPDGGAGAGQRARARRSPPAPSPACRTSSRSSSSCPSRFATGIGLPYDAFGPRRRQRGVERMLAPWFRTMLVPHRAAARSTASWRSWRRGPRSPTSAAVPASR